MRGFNVVTKELTGKHFHTPNAQVGHADALPDAADWRVGFDIDPTFTGHVSMKYVKHTGGERKTPLADVPEGETPHRHAGAHVGGILSVMTDAEKTAVDDAPAALAATRTAKKDALRNAMLATINAKYDQSQISGLQALGLRALINSWTNRQAKIEVITKWVEDMEGEYYTAKAAVEAAATTVAVNAVTANYAQFPAPSHTVADVRNTLD